MQETAMKIDRVWAMPNPRTFTIPPIRRLIEEEKQTGVCIEPFPYQSRLDAFDFLRSIPDRSVDFCLLDPPYSGRQVKEHYNERGVTISSWHTSAGFMAQIKDEVARVMRSGSKVITFGWNSNGIGKKRGFEIIRILLVAHGSAHNDTICTVEKKT